MLPKTNRIKLNRDKYKQFHKKGRRYNTSLFQFLILKTDREEPPRFVFVVPKKLDKRATRRNRTRRLLATAVFSLLPRVKKGQEVMIFSKKILYKKQLEEVQPIVAVSFEKANLLKKQT